MYPVYVKGDQEQIAPTPRDEVRLRFAGWRRKEEPAPQQPSADETSSDAMTSEAEPPAESSTTRRTKRGNKSSE